MVIISTRKQQKAFTKAKITDKTRKLLAKNGFVKVSTKQIARAANVSQGTIFLHFNTKNELLHSILTNAITDYLNTLKLNCDVNSNDDSFIKNFIDVLIQHERLIARVYMDYAYLPELLKREINNLETIIKNLIFDHIRKDDQLKLSIVDSFIAIDAFYAQIVKHLLEKEVFSETNSIIRNRRGKILKLYKMIFMDK